MTGRMVWYRQRSVPYRLLWSLCLVGGLAAPWLCHSAYFFVTEGTDKCFIENVPQNVAMTVAYHNTDNQGVSCAIIFKDPNGQQGYKRDVLHTAPKGKVTYLTQSAGDHQVCISCASSKWVSTEQLKWALSIELGDTDINLDLVATKGAVGSVEGRLQGLVSIVEAINAENDYERIQEDDFRNASETVHFRVLWFSVTQILLLSLTTLFSVFHLTKFFQTQKII